MSSFAKKTALLILVASTIFASPAPRVEAHGSGETPPDSFIIRGAAPALPDTGSFVNYEIPHVHPLDINDAATRLAACNTPDGMVEIYSVDGATGDLTHIDSIRVGYAPVSARFRSDTELWVVNHISDSISIVDTTSVPGKVIDTIQTYDGYNGTHAGDEPADVVFTSTGHALVSGSRSDVIQRYTEFLGNIIYVDEFQLDGEDPRMLALNAAGTSAYAAIFESGNGSTLISGALADSAAFPPDTAMTDATNPYGGVPAGQNQFFNNGIPGSAWVAGGSFITPASFTAVGTPLPPRVPLIVKKDAGGIWRDDNGADWSPWISGAKATLSGRFNGWDLMDNDVAILTSADSFVSATYATRQMNHVMAVAVDPATGEVFSVGTDATNEVRFEPNITGTFTRVMLAVTDAAGTILHLLDLNEEHLDAAQGGSGLAYSDGSVPQTDRDHSIGDPRGIAFKPSSTIAYISGMGSNNVLAVNTGDGSRLGTNGEYTIEVGHGPTGIIHHPGKNRLYVLNKFDASITVIDTTTPGSEPAPVQTLPFFDPTPDFINDGRVHTYGTHENSGLGQIACASCHIDTRMDRLAWDLGNPAGGSPLGVERILNTADILTGIAGVQNFIFGAVDQHGAKVHTMKGPMTTQTLQDIIQHEPLHWRGDRFGVEEFSGAFAGLQGDDAPLGAIAMQEFENFLSTIHFTPNPFRAIDNSLPGGPQIVGGGTNPNLPLPGHFAPGDMPVKADTFSPPGTPLPSGNAWQGFDDYVDAGLDGGLQCATCHALPMGGGPATTFGGALIMPGPKGEAHIGMVNNDGTGQPHIKIPQTRNQFDKEGFYLNFGDTSIGGNAALATSRAGFGLVHDGVVDGLARFLAEPVFNTFTDQDLADIVAFSLCINGGGYVDLFGLPGGPSGGSPDGGPEQTAHAAVGHQVLIKSGTPTMADQDLIDLLVTLADNDAIGLIATGIESAAPRSWYHVSGTGAGAVFQRDDSAGTQTLSQVQANASTSDPLTFMAVPTPSDVRMGVDRDDDDAFNSDELGFNTDNANPDDHKFVDAAAGGTPDGSQANPFMTVAAGVAAVSPSAGKSSVVHIQSGSYNETITITKPTQLVAVGFVTIGAP